MNNWLIKDNETMCLDGHDIQIHRGIVTREKHGIRGIHFGAYIVYHGNKRVGDSLALKSAMAIGEAAASVEDDYS